jgi:hypothetical protein
MAKKRKVPKDKKSGVPKKYLSGLKGKKRTKRANLLKRISNLYKAGKVIPRSLLRQRDKL